MKQLFKRVSPLVKGLAKGAMARYRLKRLARQSPCRIIVGASGVEQLGWIATNIEVLNLLKPQDWGQYFAAGSIDAILAEHVWEHLTRAEGIEAARTCCQYLKPGGYLRVAVPDGCHPDPTYREWVRPGGIGPGADDHKVLYTYQTFRETFETAGLRVDLLEYFDENGDFHFQDWKPDDGMIHRSRRFDRRNRDGKLGYTSLILDARKGP